MTDQTVPLAHSIPDAAERIGVGRTTMYALIESGDVKAINIGRRRMVTEKALLAFLDGLEAAQP